jgi:branched-chain amino acid transport system substrate-binding protein
VAQVICDYTKDMLVGPFHLKTAVIMSEDAAWTTPFDAGYLQCLPKAGLKVLDHIRFNPDTTDFTPIFRRIEDAHPGNEIGRRLERRCRANDLQQLA